MIVDKIMDIFEALFNTLLGWIIGPFDDLNGIGELIYGRDGDQELAYGIFTLDEIEKIYLPGMNIFVALSVTGILVGIVIAGMRVSSAGINPSNRTIIIEFFKDLIVVGLVFFNLSTLYHVIFAINYTIVNAFKAGVKEQNSYDGLVDWVTGMFDSFADKGVLGGLFIALILLGLSIWANFYYVMRKFTLLMLMIMGPLMMALYLIPKTKPITTTWFKELVGNVFVQSVHAGLYWMMMLLTNNSQGLMSVLLYATFIPVAETFRSLLGLGGELSGRMAKAGAMVGFAALGSMAGAVKGALDGKSVLGSINEAYRGFKDRKKDGLEVEKDAKSGVLNNAGTDIGSSVLGERMLKSGQIFSKAGKAVFGIAGAVVGSPMGPIGSIAGATIGSAAGSAAGGLAGRIGAATSQLGLARVKGAVQGAKKGIDAFKGVMDVEKNADEKLAQAMASEQTAKWAIANKEKTIEGWKKSNRFPDMDEKGLENMWSRRVQEVHKENLDKARNLIRNLRNAGSSFARSSDLVNPTVDKLTEDWAKNNKDAFMRKFNETNPLPANASASERKAHFLKRDNAWKQAVEGKREEIKQAVSSVAQELTHGTDAFIGKSEFANAVGQNVSSIIGKESRATAQIAAKAIKPVRGQSLYSGKQVNAPVLASRLAIDKLNNEQRMFVEQGLENKVFDSKSDALRAWKDVAPGRYQENLKGTLASLPKHIPIAHKVSSSNSFVTGAKAVISGVAAGTLGAASGAIGLQSLKNMALDNRLGSALTSAVLGYKLNQGAPLSSLGQGVKHFVDGLKTYTPQNAVEKQARFRNAVAYTMGVIGGVSGYKKGAEITAGGINFQNPDGSFALKYNPFNKYVNQQIAEISDIQQMAQTVSLPNGQQKIASGAIRMVTSRDSTVIQVRDKAGQIRTVSRIGSGDSSLKQGQTIYQDLTIENGQLIPVSGAYKLDSGGARIALNRNINVNPNRLVANRNTPPIRRVTLDVQPYSQFVDSGQYYLKDVANEMTNIQMIVERDRSYLVGHKDGKKYRISPYGPGDARLETNEVVYRKCAIENMSIKVIEDYLERVDETGNAVRNENYVYSSSLNPNDMIKKYPPNKRNLNRQLIEKSRVKSLTEPLR
ncbi:type IV secretion system protein [Parageobacillus thermoglucosidasius]|uniref:type IV secretion system protein n=1 Tax=Parageobacillus thermoglucosidasius TaxID=1426 RepID=UPI000B54D192|nr:type IV secretion system protein [Parageobacillus thermoglucosidasius]OUM91091.1 MAG: hypothetical protein BAA00_16540 [Parageobacillus thermoglucosidasius]